MTRTLLRACCAVLAMLLAIPVVRIGIADLQPASTPERALAWWPHHVAALGEVAQRGARRGGDAASARTAAQTLLRNSPLAGFGYRTLAQLADAGGDDQTAAALYRIAARRAPRDRLAHAWLASHDALRGDFASAVAEIDELLRIQPGLLKQLTPTLASFVAIADARKALLDHLGNQPVPWRPQFLVWMAAQPDLGPLLPLLFSPLRSARHALTAGERRAWMERLLRDDRVLEAYYLWVDGLPAERRGVVGNVHDGGFEFAPDNAGFGWRIGRIAGASIRLAPTSGAHGRNALLLDFHDRRVPFAHVEQRLALAPGRYRLSGRVRVDGLRNERGLHWVLACQRGPRLAESERFTGRSDWQPFAFEFERPAEGCNGQVLQLRLAARIAPEQMVGGGIAFDDLRVQALH